MTITIPTRVLKLAAAAAVATFSAGVATGASVAWKTRGKVEQWKSRAEKKRLYRRSAV